MCPNEAILEKYWRGVEGANIVGGVCMLKICITQHEEQRAKFHQEAVWILEFIKFLVIEWISNIFMLFTNILTDSIAWGKNVLTNNIKGEIGQLIKLAILMMDSE